MCRTLFHSLTRSAVFAYALYVLHVLLLMPAFSIFRHYPLGHRCFLLWTGAERADKLHGDESCFSSRRGCRKWWWPCYALHVPGRRAGKARLHNPFSVSSRQQLCCSRS